jgi:hypothetical protein
MLTGSGGQHLETGPATRISTPTRVGYATKDAGMRPDFLTGYADNADDMQLVTFENPGDFIADDQPAAEVDGALKLFRAH